jgi:hypothetical protein
MNAAVLDRAMFPNHRNAILAYYDRKQLKIAASRLDAFKTEIESVGRITDARLKLLRGLSQCL